MNIQANPKLSTDLSTGSDELVPAREQSYASIVYKDRQGDWCGKTQWMFGEKPALANDEPGEWIIELRTGKGSRGIANMWTVMRVYKSVGGFDCTRHMLFGDFSHREQAAGGATRATSKAIAEAHTIAVQQIERIAAAAVAFYKDKQQ